MCDVIKCEIVKKTIFLTLLDNDLVSRNRLLLMNIVVVKDKLIIQ